MAMAKKTLVELDKERLFEALRYSPHEGQLAVHRSKARRRILITGSRFGKSLCAAHEAVAFAMEPRKRAMIWIVAPTMDLSDKVFREVVVVVAENLKHRLLDLKQHDKRMLLRNLGGGVSEIRGKTADNPVSLLGEGLDFLIVDEAARLRPSIWHSFLSQRLIDKDGSALLISTPKGRGWLWDLWKRGQPGGDPDYESWQFPSWTNPHLKRDLIEAERERLPEAVFAQELAGQFVEGAGAVFRYVRDAATGEWQQPVAGERYFAGLDLAKVADYSVLVILNQKRQVVFVDRFNKLDWNLQVTRVKAATDRFNQADINVDSTGAGEPVFENMRRAGLRVRPYSFTMKSKADLIANLSLMLEKRQIVLPRYELCPELIDELESYEYSVSEAGTIRTNAPSGQHDDATVALSLGAWLLRRDPARMIVRWV